MRDRRGAIDGDDRRRGQGEERVVENGDRHPVRGPGQPTSSVGRLNRRLELEAGRRAERARPMQQPLGLLDRGPVPAFDFLLAERNVAPLFVASRLGGAHARKASAPTGPIASGSFGMSDTTTRPSQIASSARFRPRGSSRECFRPSVRKGGVDRLQRHAEPLGQILPLGNSERHAREANFRLRAREALAHCRWRNQKGRGNRRRVQTKDRLQHQRRAYRLLDRRMGASEHEREAPVGNPVRRVGGLLQFGVDQLERFRRLMGGASPAAPHR